MVRPAPEWAKLYEKHQSDDAALLKAWKELYGRNPDDLKQKLQGSQGQHFTGNFCDTPVHAAARNSLPECLRWTVNTVKLDPNAPSSDKYETRPLFCSGMSGKISDCVKILLEAGADPWGVNWVARTSISSFYEWSSHLSERVKSLRLVWDYVKKNGVPGSDTRKTLGTAFKYGESTIIEAAKKAGLPYDVDSAVKYLRSKPPPSSKTSSSHHSSKGKQHGNAFSSSSSSSLGSKLKKLTEEFASFKSARDESRKKQRASHEKLKKEFSEYKTARDESRKKHRASHEKLKAEFSEYKTARDSSREKRRVSHEKLKERVGDSEAKGSALERLIKVNTRDITALNNAPSSS